MKSESYESEASRLKESLKPRCSIEECNNTRQRRKYCNKHYLRWYRNGDPLIVKINRTRKPGIQCSDSNCGLKAKTQGMCMKHWQRFVRNGDLSTIYPDRDNICIVDKCNRNIWCKKMCTAHYQEDRTKKSGIVKRAYNKGPLGPFSSFVTTYH